MQYYTLSILNVLMLCNIDIYIHPKWITYTLNYRIIIVIFGFWDVFPIICFYFGQMKAM